MNKTDYLDDVREFVDYLYNIISNNECINYSYTITHAPWKKWAKDEGYLDAGNRATYDKWDDLLKRYYWAGGDFQANKDKLNGLVEKIQRAIASESDEKTFIESTRILDWGQTYKGSITWLLNCYDNEGLVVSLSEAVRILDGDQWGENEINQFTNGVLQMDSGLTKIFSLASQKSIIYDGRTAAALAYLVVQYLEGKVTELDGIPANLKFAVDKSKKESARNPKYKKFTFRNKTTNKVAHAESNIWANWIIGSVVDKARESKDKGQNIFNKEINDENYSHCIREIEAALFMMGSRIDGR